MELLTEEQWMLDISSFSIAPHKGQPKIESVVALLFANNNYLFRTPMQLIPMKTY